MLTCAHPNTELATDGITQVCSDCGAFVPTVKYLRENGKLVGTILFWDLNWDIFELNGQKWYQSPGTAYVLPFREHIGVRWN